MMTRDRRFTSSPRRGAAALAVSLVLLFGMTLVAFFANRSFIFEQRTSTNQYRSTRAFELAEAGIEWAVGHLNSQIKTVGAATAGLDASCSPDATGTQSLRERFLVPRYADATHPKGYFAVNSTVYPGCYFDSAGVAHCDCPASGAANLGNTSQPRFRVQFVSYGADARSVEVISRGCTNGDPCDPTQAASGDSSAVVRVLLSVTPVFPNGPAAALTAGRGIPLNNGNLNVINNYAPSNGITINSGAVVDMGAGIELYTLPGTPPRASVLDNDPSLATMAQDGEKFFAGFFGQSVESYKQDAVVLNCSALTAAQCGSLVVSNLGGRRQFYIEGDVSFGPGNVTGGVLGSSDDPVTIVSTGEMSITGSITAYGVFYADSADGWAFAGSGTATIYGGFISRGSFEMSAAGTLNLVYDPNMWGGTAPPRGLMIRVPGSWRDKIGDF